MMETGDSPLRSVRNRGITARIKLISAIGVLLLSTAAIAAPPGVPEPDIAVTDSSGVANDYMVGFGTVSGGGASSHSVTIGNNGNTSLFIGTISSADALGLPFTLDDTASCSGSSLTPGSSCTFNVLFTPVSNGAYNDTFDIPSDDPDENPVTITVTGTGTDIVLPPGSNTPDITVTDVSGSATDLSIDFGSRSGGSGWANTVTITNDGNSDLALGSIAQSDPLANPYSIINSSCGTTLTVGSSCTFEVLFTPTSNGIFTDTFDIPSDDPDENPVTFSVTGTSTDIVQPPSGGDADITPTDDSGAPDDLHVDFGIIEVGQSISNTVTLTNDGTAVLTIGNIADASTLTAPYSIQGNGCATGNTLAPAENCMFDVQFAPASAGIFSAIVNVPSDDPDEPLIKYSLTGIANTPGNNPPTRPVLVSPVYNAVGVTQPVNFSWESSTDPDADSITYRLYYSTDPGFANSSSSLVAYSRTGAGNAYAFWSLSMISVGMVLAGRREGRKLLAALLALGLVMAILLGACGGGGGGGYIPIPDNKVYHTLPDTLDTGVRYYWKVSADDGRGGIAYSDVWAFTTE